MSSAGTREEVNMQSLSNLKREYRNFTLFFVCSKLGRSESSDCSAVR